MITRRGMLERMGAALTVLTKGLALAPPAPRGGWWPVVREPFTGAWQQNAEISTGTALTYSAVFACVTLIASDIGKLCGNGLHLVAVDDEGIWTRTESPAFSPFLRRPNRYQNRIKFAEQWITSKLIHGNTYVLKERDARGLVVAGYILDPTKVTPLVATSGDVYYQLRRDDLSGLPEETVTVPAREIMHDLMIALYHPLIGVSPIYACGIAALQGLSIQTSSQAFFKNSSQPGGILTTPNEISDETAAAFKERWLAGFTGANAGKVAILSHGMKYEPVAVTATDAQLIEQLKWTADVVCSCFHIQPYMISAGPPPPYANIEPLTIQYYSQCLQSLIENFELCLDEGLELPKPYGTEIALDDLLRMDSVSRTSAASSAISSGALTINEARQKYFDLGSVTGGDTPYLQQQYWPLDQLAGRAIPAIPAAPPATPPPPAVEAEAAETEDAEEAASFVALLYQKAVAGGLYAEG
jgi:HK97 family phage portal protein